MKYLKYLFLLFLLFLACTAANAQLFKPFVPFRVIKTEHFDIVFPKESEPSARLLATYADSLYKDVSSILGIEVRERIPVTLAPHTDMFNGYYSHMSYPHIVLYDTPMDIEWTVYEDNLKGLFLHELVHAVTINTGDAFFQFLRRVFGYWASPAFWTAPLFMIEGATVSFESLSGFGRANDPLIKQKLRQAIYEDKFLTPFQVSGVYDLPNQSGVYYQYGGLFSYWLQKEYGIEQYSELWRAMGRSKDTNFSFLVYRSFFYDAFRKVYGIEIMDAWNAFEESLALDNIEEKPEKVLPAKYRFKTKINNTVSAIASKTDNIYIIDSTERKINVLNTQTQEIFSYNSPSFYSYDLDVSGCGSNLLVSEYNSIGDMFKAVITEIKADTGRKTGRAVQGLYKARYFKDGVIGIKSELHNNSIVYMDFNGGEELLFKGNENLMFSGPQVLDDNRIIFIAAKNGIRRLLLYNYETKELFRAEESSGNNNYWHYMRGLNVSDNKLMFSYNSNDRMYKLAYINFDSMKAIFNERDFSGGVFNPVACRNNIYYSGSFFNGDEVLLFPESADSITGAQQDIILISINAQEYGFSSVNKPEENISSIISSKPFFGIKYMSPLKLWVPLPLIRSNTDTFKMSLDGGGIFSMLMDPADRNIVMFYVYYDAVYKMLRVEDFNWQTTIPGVPLSLTFNDVVETNSTLPYRRTQISLSANLTHTPARFIYGISLGAGYTRFALGGADNTESAYNWKEFENVFYYSAAFSISNRLKRQYETFGKGFSFSFRGANIISAFQPRIEGLFQFSAEKRIPFIMALYGAYDKSGMNLQGVSNYYSSAIYSNFSSNEYANIKINNLDWIAGGEIGFGIFSLEIQKNFSHIYINRFRGTLSLKNLLYDNKGGNNSEGIIIIEPNLHLAQSLFLKLGLVSSIVPLTMQPIILEPVVWGAWKFSNTISGNGSSWNAGININIQF